MAEKRGSSKPSKGDGIDEYVERIVRAAPPFSARQRVRIAAILTGEEAVAEVGQQVRKQDTRSGVHSRRRQGRAS